MPLNQKVYIEKPKNTTFNPNVEITANGVPVNLTGSIVKFAIKNDPDDTVALKSVTCTAVDLVNGIVKVPDVLLDLEKGKYYFDFSYTDSLGVKKAPLYGIFIITPSISL